MKLGIGLSLTRQRILGSGFSPSDISNLDIWYDFSTITADNDTAVSSFANAGLGGSNYNLSQSSSGDQPTVDTSTMAKTSIEFTDAGTHSLDLANNYLTTGKTYTIFLVYKRDDLNDTDFLFVGDTAGHNKVELYVIWLLLKYFQMWLPLMILIKILDLIDILDPIMILKIIEFVILGKKIIIWKKK